MKRILTITVLVIALVLCISGIPVSAQNAEGESDIKITKSDSADPVSPGEEFTYTIVVTNDGPNDAGIINITDNFPPGIQILAAAASTGLIQIVLPNTVQWDIGGLVTGDSATATCLVRVKSDTLGVITNTVEATTDHDPDPSNNTASENTLVEHGDLSILEVGGTIYTVNKLTVLAPWLALVAVLILGIILTVNRRRVKS